MRTLPYDKSGLKCELDEPNEPNESIFKFFSKAYGPFLYIHLYVRFFDNLFGCGCKHGKVDNSWSLRMFKWKWLKKYQLQNNLKKRWYTFIEHLELQSQVICIDKNNAKKSLHILEEGASGYASGDIEYMIVEICFKIRWNYIKLMVSYKHS